MTSTVDTSVLEERAKEIDQYKRVLVQAEEQKRSAEERITQIDEELTTLGVDVTGDLDEQVAGRAGELDTLIEDIVALLHDVEEQLTTTGSDED